MMSPLKLWPAKFTFSCGHKGVTPGKRLWNKLDEREYAALVDVRAVQAPNLCGWECANACSDEELQLALVYGDEVAVDEKTTTTTTTTATTTTATTTTATTTTATTTTATTTTATIPAAAAADQATKKRKFREVDKPTETEIHFMSIGLRKSTAAHKGRMGQPDATYGVPRLGVGWRPEEPQEPVDLLLADLDSLAAAPELPPAPAALLVAPSPMAPQLVHSEKKAKKENNTSSSSISSSISSSSTKSSSISSSINSSSSVGDLTRRVQTDNRPGVGSIDKDQAPRNKRMDRFMAKYVNAKR